MMISFGHFIRQSSPVNSLIALQTARPARGVIDDTSDGAIFGLNKNENVMLSSFFCFPNSAESALALSLFSGNGNRAVFATVCTQLFEVIVC